MWRRRAVTATATALISTMTACDTEPDPHDDESSVRQASVNTPTGEVTVLAEDEPGALALAVSRALFDHAPVVLLAAAGNTGAHEAAAATATDLGAPLLLTPEPYEDGDALADELARLQVEAVLAVDPDAERWTRQLPDSPVAVASGPASPSPTSPGPTPSLPPVQPPEPLSGVAVLSSGAPHTVAAAATARIAGAQVQVTDVTDPRADPQLIEALAADPPGHTIGLGAGFGPVDRFRSRLTVAASGVQLPGGGQVLFPGRRLVALYGHPGDSVLGVLGEQPLQETIDRAQKVAGEYESLVDEPVVPTLEIITTVASGAPGPEGDYSVRTSVDKLRSWVDAAAEAGMYVVLDLQPGHTDFLTQAQEYEELLVEPHVGLALDPEWRLAPDEEHMVNIGSVDSGEVNQVADWLAALTAEHRLPQKLLVLHQFTLAMIGDRDALDTSHDELAMMIHADGFGSPGQKLHTWEALHRGAPDVWWGWKNFYDEDNPTFTPAETVDIEPTPRFISYQ